jgi:hypothetical protein
MPRFNSNSLARAWATGETTEGRTGTGNFSFRNGILFSYSTAIGKRIAAGRTTFALITSERHSATTDTKHRAPAVGAAVRTGLRLFSVPIIWPQSSDEHAHNVRHLLAQAADAADRATRARTRKIFLLNDSRRLIREAAEYAAYFIDPDAATLPDLILADWLEERGYDDVAHALRG